MNDKTGRDWRDGNECDGLQAGVTVTQSRVVVNQYRRGEKQSRGETAFPQR